MTVTAAPAHPPDPGHDPSNLASPNVNTPPSAPTMKYPPPSAEGTMPTIGAFSFLAGPGVPAGAMPRPGIDP